ncbi:MAG: hypothetical protein ABI273_09725 [Lacunisphaera sp.]
MRYFSFLALLLLVPLASAQTQTPPLLRKAVEKWLGEKDNWAFTLHVREFDGGKVKEERTERYDPSKPGIERWQLLAVNGKTPTNERRAEWQKHKTKKRKSGTKPLDDYFEFEQAKIVKVTDKTIGYHVPLRNNSSWLFPVDKVDLRVTVDKKTYAIEDVAAGIDEPFKVALGLGRVLDVDFDVQMNQSASSAVAADPAMAKPDGTAKVVVNKLGQRIEYGWSNFQRVTPDPENVVAPSPSKLSH